MKNLKNWHVLPIPDLGQNFSDFNFSFFLFTLYYFYFIQEFPISHWNDRSILSQRYPFFPLKHTSRIITISLFIFTKILHHQFLQNVFPKNHNFVNLPCSSSTSRFLSNYSTSLPLSIRHQVAEIQRGKCTLCLVSLGRYSASRKRFSNPANDRPPPPSNSRFYGVILRPVSKLQE